MAKILQNTTASPVVLTDVGVTVPASGNYTINPNDYLLFAASSNTITQVGSGVLTVSDGSSTLSIADGTSLLLGLFPSNIVSNADVMNGSYPDPGGQVQGSASPLSQDSFGNLQTRGTVLTDEGSYRDDFTGSSLNTTLTGTISVVNGNNTLNGTGTTFTTQLKQGQYVKVSSQAETAWTQVDYIVSDTQAILIQGYIGATASAVAGQTTNWETTTGTGAAFTVTGSNLSFTSGTTNGQSTNIVRIGDYLPYTIRFAFSISQRIANQTAIIGFADVYPTPNQQAVVQFTGTTNTTVNFVTSFSSAAADTQTTAVTLPNGGTTNTSHVYKIDLSATQATLSIDGIVVAVNSTHLPAPYTPLVILENITNTGTAGSSTTLTTDYIYFANLDIVQVGSDFVGEAQQVNGNVSSGTADSGAPVKVGGVFNSTLPTLSTGQRGDVQLDANGRLLVTSFPVDGGKATYSATSAIAFASVATATDIFTITGSASKTIRILRIGFSATQTTAAAINVLLIKRSAANTGGTSATATNVPHDSGDAAGTATVRNYTANPTGLGASVGTVRAVRAFVPTTALASTSQYYEFDFGQLPEKALLLKGTAEVLAMNLNSTTIAGGAFTCWIEWTEE